MSAGQAIRGQQLMVLGRWADAAEAFRNVLAEDPGDAQAHARLALCLSRLGDHAGARREAAAAVAAAPDDGGIHHLRAMVLLADDRPHEAETAAREALRLDPDDADHHHALAACLLRQDLAQPALAQCDRGLACDPEHAGLTDLRASLLTRLGRREEAEAAISEALRRNPEDAEQHANLGWARLHAGRSDDAVRHCAEALRLDPDSDFARQGLVEALKARYWLYRLFLAWLLWLTSLPPSARWAVILGGWLVYRLAMRLADLHPVWSPWLTPLVWAYFGFAVLTWLAQPLFNLLLVLHPLGREALSARERTASRAAGIGILIGIGGIVAYPLTGHALGLLVAMSAALCTCTLYAAFAERVDRRRRTLIPATLLHAAWMATALVLVGLEIGAGATAWGWALWAWLALLILPGLLRARSG